MAVVTTGQIAKALRPGVKTWWGQEYNAEAQEWSRIFDVESSSMAYEEAVQLVGTGLAPVKPEGTAISYDSFRQGYTTRLTHSTYALGMIITEEMIDDNQYTQVARARARMLGRSMKLTKEHKHANILNNAFDSNYPGGDAKELLATDHPLQGGGTFQNELTTAADLSESALEDLLILIDQAVDDRGLKIALKGQMLVIAPGNRFVAQRIMASTNQTGTANNDINAVRSLGFLPSGYMVNHYLTDADAWFVKTDVMDGLKHYRRRAPSGPVSDNDFDTSNVRFKVSERYVAGWIDPRGLYGSAGA